MAYMASSGNATVDAMGQIAITGNVTPVQWYKTVLRDNGKPHLLAITILSDLVYWFRPTEVRDERSGQVIGWKKNLVAISFRRVINSMKICLENQEEL